MKTLSKLHIKGLAGIFAACLAIGSLSSCQDDFDDYKAEAPVASVTPNTTILELKKEFWQDATNYAEKIGTKEDGSHYIIHGYVTSSDEPGNVFKSLYIQDETAGLVFSINTYNLYLQYRRGQEIIIDLTGMYIGKYAGLMQIGDKEWTDKVTPPSFQVSFMSPQQFTEHAELNGYPDLAKVDTLVFNSISEIGATPEDLMKYQGQLIRINNVSFQNGGTAKFSEYHETMSQNIVDASGQSLAVRTSGYSNFWNKTLPAEKFDIVALLGFFNTSYQLTLIDYEGCMNIGNATPLPGTEENPYTVEQAISLIDRGLSANGWVTGYIVGTVGAEVSQVTGNGDIEWTDKPELDNSIVIGATPETTDYTKCLVLPVNSGTALWKYGVLANHPENYKRQIWVKGSFGKLMSMAGITGNNGSASEFKIQGVEVPDEPIKEMKTIYSESFASDLGKFTTDNVVMPSNINHVWSIDTRYSCAKASAFVSNVKYATDSYLVSPEIDLTEATQAEVEFEHAMKFFANPKEDATLWVSVNKGEWQQVTINTYGDNNSFTFVTNTTDLTAFAGKKIRVAFRYRSSESACGTWELKNFVFRADAGKVDGGGGEGPNPPTPPTGDMKGDFNSFNGGETAHMSYSTYTNASGWTATNSLILGGSDTAGENAAPKFSFMGNAKVRAVCMNGRKDRIGTITSPEIAGGIKTLTFKYGIPYNDKSIRFIVKIIQNGNVVKEQTVENSSPVKFTAYDFSLAVNISGNFKIEIDNAPTTPVDGKNGLRVAIWDLTWD